MKYILYLTLIFNISYANKIVPIPIEIEYDVKKAKLGQELFFEKRLSDDDTISCASCHLLSEGGDDNMQYSKGVYGKIGVINSSTVLNSRYNFKQFWNGRVDTLEEQVLHPIVNPIEMGANHIVVVKKLKNIQSYVKKFKDIYNAEVNIKDITNAIAEFEKTLVTPNSRFDKYLRGDKTALSAMEEEGYELFQTNGCISCHNGMNVGGNLFQKVGVMKTFVDDKNTLGRYDVTQNVKDKYYFKVPTLRNIELTAPYLHDGSLETLRSVVRFMTVYQLGMIPQEDEIEKVVMFLKTLTGENPKFLEK